MMERSMKKILILITVFFVFQGCGNQADSQLNSGYSWNKRKSDNIGTPIANLYNLACKTASRRVKVSFASNQNYSTPMMAFKIMPLITKKLGKECENKYGKEKCDGLKVTCTVRNLRGKKVEKRTTRLEVK